MVTFNENKNCFWTNLLKNILIVGVCASEYPGLMASVFFGAGFLILSYMFFTSRINGLDTYFLLSLVFLIPVIRTFLDAYYVLYFILAVTIAHIILMVINVIMGKKN